jgi:hypothetical protein
MRDPIRARRLHSADRRGLSGALRRVPREALYAAVALRPRRLPRGNLSRRCDTHGNALTLIQDQEGNVFGGFTAVQRETLKWPRKLGPESNCFKADPSLKSFAFTLMNPHNFRVNKFALKAVKKDDAIPCNSSCGPNFCDIVVGDNCSARNDSAALCFGDSDANNTGLDRKYFLTSSPYFTVKEIEVFEITV